VRVLLSFAVWVFAFVSCILFVTKTMIGPTIFVFSSRHGLHVGDVVAMAVAPMWAWSVTRSFWREEPSRR